MYKVVLNKQPGGVPEVPIHIIGYKPRVTLRPDEPVVIDEHQKTVLDKEALEPELLEVPDEKFNGKRMKTITRMRKRFHYDVEDSWEEKPKEETIPQESPAQEKEVPVFKQGPGRPPKVKAV